MTLDHRFAYAQARLQARFAALPAEADWHRLDAARTLSGYLEEARHGTLGAWVKGLSGQSDAHDIERTLRGQFLDAVERTAEAVPEPWRDAVTWCRWLPLLELLSYLQRGFAAPGWLREDGRLRAMLGADGDPDIDAFADAAARRGRHDTGEQWVAGWRARWPEGPDDKGLCDLGRLVAAHLAAFREADPDKAWPLRRAADSPGPIPWPGPLRATNSTPAACRSISTAREPAACATISPAPTASACAERCT